MHEDRITKEPDDGCWLWTGALNHDGYGMTPNRERAHRVIYEAHVGPIPEGMTLDHLCRVRRCVRPDHLEPVPHRENVLRGDTLAARNLAKTHCIRDHPFDEDNTMLAIGRNGRLWRGCRTCKRERDRRRRAA